MKLSVLPAALTIAWIYITIDAAAVKTKQPKNLGLREMSENPHAMLCIVLEGFLQVPIVKGATRLQVSKFFFVMDQTYDLCAPDMVKNGPRCPIGTNHNVRACFPLDPSMTTDVSANLKVTAYDPWKRRLFCLEGEAMVESECPQVGPGSLACDQ
ncbi:hypothetical protein BGZ74_010734 [Mortierella antarctica]|nr:hypothetical protein BGZ74_010734 [Mortierella antarctica]